MTPEGSTCILSDLYLVVSVTRLGNFLKLLARKFLAKEAQMIVNFLDYFEKTHSWVKTALSTFWSTFGKIGLLFTPTSGHTTSGNSLTKCSLSASILKSIFYFSFLAPTMQCDQMLKYKVAQNFPIDAQKATIGAFTRNVLFYFSQKINSKIWLLFKENLSPRPFKNAPIWSHCYNENGSFQSFSHSHLSHGPRSVRNLNKTSKFEVQTF